MFRGNSDSVKMPLASLRKTTLEFNFNSKLIKRNSLRTKKTNINLLNETCEFLHKIKLASIHLKFKYATACPSPNLNYIEGIRKAFKMNAIKKRVMNKLNYDSISCVHLSNSLLVTNRVMHTNHDAYKIRIRSNKSAITERPKSKIAPIPKKYSSIVLKTHYKPLKLKNSQDEAPLTPWESPPD